MISGTTSQVFVSGTIIISRDSRQTGNNTQNGFTSDQERLNYQEQRGSQSGLGPDGQGPQGYEGPQPPLSTPALDEEHQTLIWRYSFLCWQLFLDKLSEGRTAGWT